MQHNILTSFYLVLENSAKKKKLRNIFTVLFVILGLVLAVSTLVSADVFQGTTSHTVLRNLLLLDLIYVLVVAGLVAIRITKLIFSRRSRASGSRLHSRLTKVFTLTALFPTIVVAAFATISINFGMEGWFSSNVQQVVENSMQAAEAYEGEHQSSLVKDINYLSNILNQQKSTNFFMSEGNVREVLSQFQPKNLSEAFIIDFSGNIRLRGDRSYLFDFEPISEKNLFSAIEGKTVIITDWPNNEFRALKILKAFNNRLLYVTREVDGSVLKLLDETQETVLLYRSIENERYGLLFKFGLLYIAFSVVVILIAVWIALWFAERLSKPVGRLAEAAKRVGLGDFETQVTEEKTGDEIAFLGKVFNQMTRKVKQQRDKLLQINKEAEEQSRFLEAVIAGVNGGIISIDIKGCIEIINSGAKTILNVRTSTLIGKKIDKVAKEFVPAINRATNLCKDLVAEELILTRGNKSSHILLKVSARQSGGNNLMGFILTFDDITNLVAAQRDAAWGDVARRIAHEIKNPLTPIKLSAERLKKKFLPSKIDMNIDLEEYADMIIRQTEVLQRIVDEFSRFARMPEPRKKNVDVSNLVESAVLLQKSVFPNIEFRIASAVNNCKILADSDMITQALTNLLKNAAESVISSEQGARDTLLIGIIDIALKGFGSSFEITIRDTGLGLDSKKNNYFEPYVTTKKTGTGLGLAIARKIIEQHDGTLELYNGETIVHSEYNKGAIAHIRIPIAGHPKFPIESSGMRSKNQDSKVTESENV